MAIEAQLADGRILEFPDGTDPSVVQATVKRIIAQSAPIPPTAAAGFSAMDTLKSAAQGAVGATKSMLEGFGAGNAPAEYLEGISKSIGESMSPERRAEQARRAELERQAATSGSAMKEIATGIGGVAEAPLQAVAQGIGSSIPTTALGIAAAALTVPAAAAIGVTLGAPVAIAAAVGLGTKYLLGALQGAGEVKGSIYDAVHQGLREKGVSETEAKAQALKSQEYIGDNWGTISAAAGIGGVAGGTGVEKQLTKLFTKPVISEAAKQTAEKVVERGALRKITTEFAKEAGPEGLQAGQEKYAANVAMTRAGMDTPAMQGVLGAAARDALVGGLTGAAVSTTQRGEARPAVTPGEEAAPTAEATPATPTPQLPSPPTLPALEYREPAGAPVEAVSPRLEAPEAVTPAEAEVTPANVEVTPANAITAAEVKQFGTMSKANRAWMEENVTGKTPEQVRDMVVADPTILTKKPGVAAALKEIINAVPALPAEPVEVEPVRGGTVVPVPAEPAEQPTPRAAEIAPTAGVVPPAADVSRPVAGEGTVTPPVAEVPPAPPGPPAPATAEDAVKALTALMQDPRTPPATKRSAVSTIDLLNDKTLNSTDEDKESNLGLAARVLGFDVKAGVVGPKVAPEVVAPRVQRGMFDSLVREGTPDLAEEAPAKKVIDEHRPDWAELSPTSEEAKANRAARSSRAKKKFSMDDTGENGPKQTLDDLAQSIAADTSFLGQRIQSLLKSGKLKLEAVHPEDPTIGGEYDGRTTTLYAAGIRKGSTLAVILHEVGAHMGLENMLGKANYQRVVDRIKELAASTRPSPERALAQEALKRIPADTLPEHVNDEIIAYFVETMANMEAAGALPKAGVLRQMWNQFKAAFIAAVNRTLGTQFGMSDLSPRNIADMARAALIRESYRDVINGETTAPKRTISPASQTITAQMEARAPDNSMKQPTSDEVRTMIVDSMASIIGRLNKQFKGAVRSTTGKLNPAALMRQAADTGKFLTSFVMQGGFRKDPATGQYEVFSDSDITPPAEIFNIIDRMAKAAGMDAKEMQKHASVVLEGVRLHHLRAEYAKAKALADFKPHMTDAQIATQMASYNATPELQQISEIMDKVRLGLVDHMERVGRITPEMAAEWKAVVGYVPFDRLKDVSNYFAKSKKPSGKGIGQFGKIPEFVGSFERPVGNVFENYIGTLGWMMRQITTTDAVRSTLEVLASMGEATYLKAVNDPRKITQMVYVKGIPHYYALQTKFDKYAFAEDAPPPMDMVKLASKISNILRLSVTALPPFALKQVVEDVGRAVLFSGVKNPASLIAPALRDFFRIAVAEWRGQIHPIVRKLGSRGLVGEVDFNPNETGEFVMQQMGLKQRTLLGGLMHKLEGITRASDLAVRNAVYEQTLKETKDMMPGGDVLLAETRARELINFRRKGASASVGFFISTVPFFNAYLQGTDLVYRNAMGTDSSMGLSKAEAAKQFRTRAAMVFGFSLMYAIAKSDDDDYKKMDLRTRNSNWIVGGGIKIPVAGELAALFKVPAETLVEYYKRSGTPEEQKAKDAVGTVLSNVWEQYAGRVTPVPQAVKPLMEAFLNHSFLTGRDLEGQHQQGMERHLRKTGATSGLATAITEFLSNEMGVELSPIKVDTVLDGYFGSASAVTKMLTDGVLNPNKPDRPLEKWLLLSNYMYETGDNAGTRPMDEFYKLNERTSMAAKTMNELSKTDVNAAIKYGQSHANEIAVNKSVQHTLMQLSKLRAAINLLQSPNGAEWEPNKAERDSKIKELRAIELKTVTWVREIEHTLGV